MVINSAREVVILEETLVCQISIHGSNNNISIHRVFRTEERLKSFTSRRAGITAQAPQTFTAIHALRIRIVTQNAHPNTAIHVHRFKISTHAHQLFTVMFLTLHGVPHPMESQQALKTKKRIKIKRKIKKRIKRNSNS